MHAAVVYGSMCFYTNGGPCAMHTQADDADDAQLPVVRTRYAREMSTYVPQKDWEKQLKKAKKARKDPNAPKRPMPAFMLFCNEIRSSIRAEVSAPSAFWRAILHSILYL